MQGSLHPEAGHLFLSTKEPSTDQVMHLLGSSIFPQRVPFPNLHIGTLKTDVALLAWPHAGGVAPTGLRSSATSRWCSGPWPHSGLGRRGAGGGHGGRLSWAMPWPFLSGPQLPQGYLWEVGHKGPVRSVLGSHNITGFAVSWGSAQEGGQSSLHYDPGLCFHSTPSPLLQYFLASAETQRYSAFLQDFLPNFFPARSPPRVPKILDFGDQSGLSFSSRA